MPEWSLYYTYAEQFGCHPQDVERTVTAEAWHRWKVWRKARASRDVWESWRQGNSGALTADQQALLNWAMLEEY